MGNSVDSGALAPEVTVYSDEELDMDWLYSDVQTESGIDLDNDDPDDMNFILDQSKK